MKDDIPAALIAAEIVAQHDDMTFDEALQMVRDVAERTAASSDFDLQHLGLVPPTPENATIGTMVAVGVNERGEGLQTTPAEESEYAAARAASHRAAERAQDKRYATDGERFWAAPQVANIIEPGWYYPGHSENVGSYVKPAKIGTDKLDPLPCEITDKCLSEVEKFWQIAPSLAARGLSSRRGFLLWGPPGSGKTSTAMLIGKHIVTALKGIVVIGHHPGVTNEALHLIRSREPTRPIMLMLEDIDAIIDQFGEATLLQMLDGDRKVDGVFTLATTNYPSRLDRRFVDRPGRFDRITYVGMPAADARAAYLDRRAPDVPEAERDRWVEKTEGWSIAHLRELVMAVCGLQDDADETIARLDKMIDKTPDEDQTDDPLARFGVPRDLGFHAKAQERAREKWQRANRLSPASRDPSPLRGDEWR